MASLEAVDMKKNSKAKWELMYFQKGGAYDAET